MMKRILIAAALVLCAIAASPLILHGGEPGSEAAAPAPVAEPAPAPVAEPQTDEAQAGGEHAADEVGGGLIAGVLPVFLHDVETYTVTVHDGAEGPALRVVPKTGFHVNTLYPWKYQAADKTYKKDDFQLTEEQATLTLTAGQDGELRFSVCNDETCLIEKIAVTTVEPQ